MDHADGADAVRHRHLDLELDRAEVVAPARAPRRRGRRRRGARARAGRPHRLTHSWVASRIRRSPITTTVSSAARPRLREAPAGAVAVDQQPVVAAGAQPGDRAAGVAAEAVGHQPLARGGLVERAAHLATERDPQARRHSSHGSASPANGSGRQIRSATSPVQPVWWLAPSPAPLSPWKYSLNVMLSRHRGSFCSLSTQPWHGRRPSGPRRNSEISRCRRSSAHAASATASGRFRSGTRSRAVAAERPGVALEVAQHEVVDRHPHRPAPVGVAAEHAGAGLAGLVVDRDVRPGEVDPQRVLLVVLRQRPQPVRREELALVEHPRQHPARLRPGGRRRWRGRRCRGPGHTRPPVEARRLGLPEEPREPLPQVPERLEQVRARATTIAQQRQDAHDGADLDRASSCRRRRGRRRRRSRPPRPTAPGSASRRR